MSHFWVGSLCRCCCSIVVGERKDSIGLYFPSDVVGASDIIRIRKDLGNNIPDKSWMLYLLELFDSGATNNNNNNHSPIALNLICQFNKYVNFYEIFSTINMYKFTNVIPLVAHSYLPQIMLHKHQTSIEYRLTD